MKDWGGNPHHVAIQSELDHLDPLADDWDTEAFSEQASSQLKLLAKLIAEETPALEDQIAAFTDARFNSTRLRPKNLQCDFQDSLYSVDRYVPPESGSEQVEHAGINGLRDALSQLRTDLANVGPLNFHFKIVRVTPLESKFETLVFVELETRGEQAIVQQSAQWKCEWTLKATMPRLLAIRIESFEEVAPRISFSRTTLPQSWAGPAVMPNI